MRIFSTEVKNLARGPGVSIYLTLLAVFGVLVPWQKGLEFLDPVILIAYCCLGAVFSGPAAVQLFADVPRSVGAALGRVALATAWGETIVLILVAVGMITVRVAHPGIFPLDLAALVGGIALGAALSFALSAMAAWLRLALSPGMARMGLRVTFAALLLAFLLRSRFVPDVVWTGAGLALAAAAVFLGLLGVAIARGAVTRVERAAKPVEATPPEDLA
jgi:hypothetical protein